MSGYLTQAKKATEKTKAVGSPKELEHHGHPLVGVPQVDKDARPANRRVARGESLGVSAESCRNGQSAPQESSHSVTELPTNYAGAT